MVQQNHVHLEKAFCTPTALQHFTKNPKITAEGTIAVHHLRPINIYSLYYRWWAAAWATSTQQLTHGSNKSFRHTYPHNWVANSKQLS